ncbi:tumor necrosis factor ligand superfamily member 15 [Sander lucioperca]|uniref:tumor necrosis factor ligand superfamily member 15 n=1 Tax=Sander lucioperca TaxID=283035 RepID=UPI00125DC1F7|nr:tumor necrosis factor ligand superfamily member 15 [Sander lucioperca]
MGEKLFGQTLPTEAVCGDAIIDMGQDKSVLILIQHCRDMKQQETRLRLITLLLLLSCTALFIFTICANLWQRENSGSSRKECAVEPSPAYSKQERFCPTANPQTNTQKLHIDLTSLGANTTDAQYVKWHDNFGDQDNKEKSAIVIPEDGFYFVYVRIALSCNEGDFNRLYLELHNWNENYPLNRPVMKALDGCTSEGEKSVFVGQLFELSKGDNLSVWIGEGYELISTSSFGAYLT